jgi:hypothetical protein
MDNERCAHFCFVLLGPLIRYSGWLRAGRSGDLFPARAKFFVHVQTGPRTHQSSCTMGAGSFPGVKRTGRGADHTPSPSAEVENEWSYTSTPPLGPWWPVKGLPLPLPLLERPRRLFKAQTSKMLTELFTVPLCNFKLYPLIQRFSNFFFKWGPLLLVRMFYGPPYSCPL